MGSSRKNIAIKIGLATALAVGTTTGILALKKYSPNSETSVVQQDIQNFKKIYNSIDLSSISDEERKWLNNLDREKLSKKLKEGLESEIWTNIDKVCGLDNLSDKDCIFYRRTIIPAYESLGAFYMQSMEN